ncbi:MGMT family protein [Candidatus Woesearchaeota archaeon]|jgi:methylated-DNA-[protein]-cysteine S-methyltransferase|nr:MGMT family protein [Candidatus Woesearchaeota archaeon]MBT3538369.1 MGMT family protein [Candidatus Woesearchaeota archaeon]MBT4698346.1 MGMT family protein [Candidatus Woesearchaeota archaeon]MBT4717167.1 MGMT family protein [Candidatus Woesearchaeota archaeon]MBT7106038.1 MGMT family protein [Candidatus Woesearchaeota archaeon]
MNFAEKVYKLCKKIPKGKVSTYKEIARAMNSKAYRAVGSALNKNPYSPKVPCHRVINSNGKIGGFASGSKKKIKLLRQEGIVVLNNRINLNKFHHTFS